jgi:hypothetical protein
VHKNVGVDFSSRWTVPEKPCTVQQVYCSACSCSYSGMSNQLWEKFARMVLHANYEATLLAAAGHEGGSGHVFLTFVGGGVFRNDMAWIVDAISRAVWNVSKIGSVQLQVHVCHYREVTNLAPLPSRTQILSSTSHVRFTCSTSHSPSPYLHPPPHDAALPRLMWKLLKLSTRACLGCSAQRIVRGRKFVPFANYLLILQSMKSRSETSMPSSSTRHSCKS